ncbi:MULTISPECIES: phage terminase small subunit P27 family [Eubacterium]|uniref:Phage terminase, small subunit, putative, P27 family n=1 Tax=Eubacterium barkeri TaxID=1528 RepID=A0A1H3BKY4_EUBBA|nr:MULTISPECIES: phage terminase small subunit P27 family [Eubacterium]MEA5073085.1 phage terminase small subunit P27 family [Eubacterium aggregans]SDX41759.1 phage terminase, small subunit, putative, P27 family [Eubacterium barkeri]
MARSRKPAELKSKHLTEEERLNDGLIQSEDKKVLREKFRNPPTWMNKESKAEYRRIIKVLDGLDYISDADINNLAGYCNAFVAYRRVTKELDDEDLTILQINARGDEKEVKNPKISIQAAYAEEMRKFAALLGLTIDSRLKIASMKVKEKKDEVEELFGDI